MGLRNRQRVKPVSREVLDRFSLPGFVTYEDWTLKGPRLRAKAEQEKREAEWYMTHRFGDPGWVKQE